MNNTCVCCGKVIPEGRQICPTCGDITDENFKSNNSEIRRNKQVEELAAYLSQFTPILSENNCHHVAEQAYKDGYRRVSEVMSNKEIEELATEIYTLFRSRPMSRALARHLYDKGWRKQKEGEWKFEHEFYGKMLCSNCKKEALANENSEYVDSDFCPNCGANMKGGAE